ncbi:hypothetical protein AVEN_96469-1 [Araneus ventricosus]|uniref:Uncharacterized protein n=1 Tax=Araneus ventricosus TaxID=182803 RepID=A0A4Y2CTZ4_ARAVE|nr:hypothetical protein AVEN_96469-1 [Araneus ventricosus]
MNLHFRCGFRSLGIATRTRSWLRLILWMSLRMKTEQSLGGYAENDSQVDNCHQTFPRIHRSSEDCGGLVWPRKLRQGMAEEFESEGEGRGFCRGCALDQQWPRSLRQGMAEEFESEGECCGFCPGSAFS